MKRKTVSGVLDVVVLALTLGYGVVFLLAEVFARDAVSPIMEAVDLGFTITFLLAFVGQFITAPDKPRWLGQNWIDLVIVVLVAIPLVRIFRFYRYLPLMRVTGLARLAAILSQGLRAHVRSYGRGNVYNILVTAVVVILLSAFLVQFAEEGAREANIKSLDDALWWAVTTVTTVGYGDRYPTTLPGRMVAAGLMLLGIALFGILTASLSSLFLAESREIEVNRLHRDLERVREEIESLRNVVLATQPRTAGEATSMIPR
jgi:voltage-gated potassium channel